MVNSVQVRRTCPRSRRKPGALVSINSSNKYVYVDDFTIKTEFAVNRIFCHLYIIQTLMNVPTGFTVVLWTQLLVPTLLDHTRVLVNQDTKEMERRAVLLQVKCGTFMKTHRRRRRHHHHHHHCYYYYYRYSI